MYIAGTQAEFLRFLLEPEFFAGLKFFARLCLNLVRPEFSLVLPCLTSVTDV